MPSPSKLVRVSVFKCMAAAWRGLIFAAESILNKRNERPKAVAGFLGEPHPT